MITFQELIRRLTLFWEKEGCVIHLGYDLEMGAGTFNPATFLRCLGPEPNASAYVEPSRRPTDGRYGENPNRMHLFHQFQVIVKPSPPQIQQTYLKSLEAAGLRLKDHDIRFVQDDWEAPKQGAWGLGWEVWIDGMEATQFTYFQMVGSQPLKPISVELTYGLECVAMFLQGVNHFLDLKWNETLTFGDIVLEQEVQWSAYNFEAATTKMWLSHFNDFEREAKEIIARDLPLPAYDFVIKASHAFNILEARGVISVTERTGYIARVRDLSRLIAAAYVSSREKLGFPLLLPKETSKTREPKTLPKHFNPRKKEALLVEIGSEELPAFFVPIGCKSLASHLQELLEKEGISYERIAAYATPRRIAVHVSNVLGGTPSQLIKRRGPKLALAFTKEGALTPQGAGFFKAIGWENPSLETVTKRAFKGLSVEGEYLHYTFTQAKKSTLALLAQKLPSIISNLDFPKKMRWGDLDLLYPRPLRWIVALFGNRVIPFELGNLFSGKVSYGHAQRSFKRIALKHADDYLPRLKEHFVLADIEERKQSICEQLKKIEESQKAHALEKDRVLKEVLFLTEWPELTVSSFNSRYLEAPKEVLSLEMAAHQRYFPLEDEEGRLKNSFVITADNTPSDLIREGNQKVLSARLADGVFLYAQDLKRPLDAFNETLKTMTFQKELGTLFEKVIRMTSHIKTINDALSLADEIKCARAATLCKSDLATALVKEFPELQGTIGKIYAQKQNEDPEVARALEEHWLPRCEGGPLPQTAVGLALSLADKIDNLLGYFSVGLKPTSSSDPYGLRRQAIGLIHLFLKEELSCDLPSLFQACAAHFSFSIPAGAIEEIFHFLTARAQGIFEEMGFKRDVIYAAVASQLKDPYDQLCKIRSLHQFRAKGALFDQLVEVYKRAKGILEKPLNIPFNPSLATERAEQELFSVLSQLETEWASLLAAHDYACAFEKMATLHKPLARLFEEVRILCEDPVLRDNRIVLLQKVFGLCNQLLDFSKIETAASVENQQNSGEAL